MSDNSEMPLGEYLTTLDDRLKKVEKRLRVLFYALEQSRVGLKIKDWGEEMIDSDLE